MIKAELKMEVIEERLKNVRLTEDLEKWKALVAELDRENETLLNEVLDESTPREVRQPQELVDGGAEALERAMRHFLDEPFFQKR